MNCLIIASLETENMRSEVQELSNTLGRAHYEVTLLQAHVNSLELYRALTNGPIRLVWIASHSNSEGFSFSGNVLTPVEIGLFLHQARTTNLVLNSCFSVEHVSTIQKYSNVNVIATIRANIDDKEAWMAALYLSKQLIGTRNLRDAYTASVAKQDTGYKWFPAPESERLFMNEEERVKNLERVTSTITENIDKLEKTTDRLEKTVDTLTKVLQGDVLYMQRGLIERTAIVETRVQTLETKIGDSNTIKINRSTTFIVVALFILAVLGIIYITYLVGGYGHTSNTPLEDRNVLESYRHILRSLYSMYTTNIR